MVMHWMDLRCSQPRDASYQKAGAGRMLDDSVSVGSSGVGFANAKRNCQVALFIAVGSLNMEPINNS